MSLSHLFFVSCEGRSRVEHHTERRWTLTLWQSLEQEDVTGWSLLFFQRFSHHRRRCAWGAWLILWEKGVKKSETVMFPVSALFCASISVKLYFSSGFGLAWSNSLTFTCFKLFHGKQTLPGFSRISVHIILPHQLGCHLIRSVLAFV